MAATGGPLVGLNINGTTYPVAADANTNRKLGGIENEFQPNGDGTSGRFIQSVVGWSLANINVEIDPVRNDQENLEAVKLLGAVTVSATYADGSVYQGSGNIVGEVNYENQSATAQISLMGAGVLSKQ